jgi:hypothetical protein
MLRLKGARKQSGCLGILGAEWRGRFSRLQGTSIANSTRWGSRKRHPRIKTGRRRGRRYHVMAPSLQISCDGTNPAVCRSNGAAHAHRIRCVRLLSATSSGAM